MFLVARLANEPRTAFNNFGARARAFSTPQKSVSKKGEKTKVIHELKTVFFSHLHVREGGRKELA